MSKFLKKHPMVAIAVFYSIIFFIFLSCQYWFIDRPKEIRREEQKEYCRRFEAGKIGDMPVKCFKFYRGL